MVAVEIVSPTLPKLQTRYAQAPAIVGEEMRAGIRALAPLARAAVVVKVRERTKRRSGRYERSIQAQITSSGLGSGLFAELAVTSNVPYAGFIERGTKPHRIRAKRRGGKLKFSIGGRTFFRPYVNHPGTSPRWVFRDAARDFQPQATRVLAAHLGNVTKRLKV
jgi:hypothetical protein